MHRSTLVQAGFFVNGCVGQDNRHKLKSDFIRERRRERLSDWETGFKVPQDDLVFMCTASKAADVWCQ